MKRLKFFFTAFLLFVAVGISAQEFPTVSTDGNVRWYAIRFVSSAKCITAYEAGEVTTASLTGDDAQMWKITGNDNDGYVFTNKNGLVLCVESAERDMLVNAEETEICVSRFAITQNVYGHLEIRPKENNSLAMNFWGGTGVNVGLWNAEPADANNYVEFVEVFSSDDYVFTLTDGVYALAGYTGNDTEIVLPAGFNGNSYVIGSRAFYGNTAITSVVIPKGVTSVGFEAFCRCSSLSALEISGTPTLQQGAFSRTGLVEVVLPEGITEIPRWCFDNSPNLISVTIPSSVTAILDYAFQGCTGLTSIEIPGSVTSIGNYAFYGCSGLTRIEIHNGVTAIGNYAFAVCSNLTSITIPNSVTSIGDNAFAACYNLTSIEIPNGVSSIGFAAFFNCQSLAGIKIPASVTDIGNAVFASCPALESIVVAEENPFYDSRNGCNAIIVTENKNLIAGCKNTVIPEDVDLIWHYAFYGTSSLENIVIPEGVTNIGQMAFYECTNLKDVTIPSTVIYIYDEAFAGCSALEDVYVYTPAVPRTEGSPFYEVNLSNATLHVDEDLVDTFRSNYPWNNFGTVDAIPYETAVVDGITYRCMPEVKMARVIAGGDPDNRYSGDIVLPEKISVNGVDYDVTSIGFAAFRDCSDLTSIVIPSSITTFGSDVFYNCSALKKVFNYSNLMFTKGSSDFGYIAYYADVVVNANGGDIVTEGDYIFAVTDGINVLAAYTGSKTDIVLPADYKGASYVIGEAFRHNQAITSVVIPNGVTGIGNYAFYNCYNLTSIKIPGSVTSIGRLAFQGCTGLTSIVIPDGVTSIGDYAFYNCYNLTSIEIPGSVTSIGHYAFFNCQSLAGIEIPASVTSVGNAVFAACSGLTEIVVAEGNTVYDSRENCNAIIETASNTIIAGCQNTVIPSSVTSIGDEAFHNCNGLTSIEIPGSITSIGYAAFAYCSGLTSIVIPDGVTSIGTAAFEGCDGLTSIVIPNSVTSIGDYAFYECYNLKTVYNNSALYIFRGSENHGFVGYYAEKVISNVVTEGNYVFTVTDGVNVLLGYTGSETDIVLPADYKGASYVIGEAFRYNDAITRVVIPNGVTGIGNYAFQDCTGLTSIEIPGSVTSIGDYAFQGCNSLNEVSIGEGVSSIGFAAFKDTAIEGIKIPASVTSVGYAVFVGCQDLAQIVVAENNSSYHSGNGCNAIIETASNTLVAGCNNTSIPAGVEIIAHYAFYYFSGLTSIEIPNSVTSIESAAFQGCFGLTEIVVAGDNTVYDSREGCNAIIETASNTLIVGCQNTVIPSSVTSIGNDAFYDCNNLTSIEISNSVTSIGNYAFFNCYNLTSIEIPNSVTSIGNYAFASCTGLTSIEIPGNVTSIGNYAFAYCYGLTSITIPNSVTSIGDYAFNGCENLKTVYNNSDLNIVAGSGNHGFVGYYAERVINNVATIGYFTFAKVNGENTLLKYDYPGDYLVNETVGLEDWTSAIVGQDNGVDSKTYEVEAAAGAVLSFDWKVSSESGYDWLRVYVDGVAVLEKSGEQSGHFEYVFDAAGVHTVEFRYSKDVSVGNGSDEGRIYDVALVTKIEDEYALELPVDYNGEGYVIGEGAFRGHDGMTSVTIPATVTNICDMAFYGCKKLGTVYNNSGLNIVAGSEAHGYVAYYAQEVIAGDNNVPVTGIELDKTSITLTEGAALQLNATVSPADATNKNVTWTSSVPSVATVENGVVTAVAEGTAVITATAGNYSAVCEVTVERSVVPVTGVTLDRSTVTLVEGEAVPLTATVSPADATDKNVTWTSSAPSVATVENGVVTAIAAGNATITATAGNYSAVCEVSVERPFVPVSGVELDNVEATLLPGESVELVATVYPDDATDKNVTWTSSAPLVATVRGGVVTAIAPGTARITAKAGNFSAFCEITVDVPYGVSLDKASLALFVGNSATLDATVNVAEGDDDTVTWTSSAPLVATVENGVVKAIAPGTATITAEAAGTTATCTVTVSKRPVAVSGIKLDKSRVTLKQGAKIALTATVEPADATNKSVTWTTSDEAVAKVNEEGVVTAVAEGTATITATAGEYSAKCRVTVTGPVLVTEVVLDIEEKTITEGKSFRLVATVGPDDADDKTVVWSTSDESVATVKDGVVTAVAPGYAVITATSGECSAECLVIVEAKYVAVRGIKLDKSRATVTEGDTLVLVATVTPENATDKNVEWTSSDEAVAVVEDGVVTAVAPGSVVITAKIDRYTAKCTITVKKGVVAVTGITLSETEVTLVEYETMTLVATVAPDDADDKSVVWSTSDEAVVTVENGVITAVAPGVAVITAEASGFTAECTVTVEALSSIDQVKLDSGTLVIYDLNGQRIVRKEDLVNGVYIINGNKVVVK